MRAHSDFLDIGRIFEGIQHRAIASVCVSTVFLLLAVFGGSALRAQDTGYISGTVTDKTGAVVVGAEVALANTAGSIARTTTTNADGVYVIAGLPTGMYTITVAAQGFQKYTARDIKLDVAEKARVDIELSVGAMTEEVTVTGESVAQVETQSSDLTSTVTGKQIENLVLNGRNFTQLVNLVPGVVNFTGQDEGTVGVYGNVAYSINGGRTVYNNWELDGGDNMDNGSNSTLNVYPNPEAIAEFKVLTSNYGAQYGRNGSGTVEVQTKSGTSSFHGSAFYYGRNEIFNARSWEEGIDPSAKKVPYKKHDFGYTFGGPFFIPGHYNVDKKKTFFFWSQEWRREKNPSSILQKVPSDAQRAGNFSDLCPDSTGSSDDCPNVPNPAAVPISPTGQALLALIPHANTTDGGFPAVTQIVSTPTTWREELIRVDHNITDNYRLTFRYIHDSWETEVPNPLWGVSTSNFQDIHTKFKGPGSSFVARLTANITPTLLNEFVASYTGDHIFLTALNNPPIPAGFAMGALFANGFAGKLPAIDLLGNTAYGGELGQDTGYFPWNNANPTYTFRDNVTKIIGKHTLIFGAYFAAAQKNEMATTNPQGILTFDTASPISTGNTFADLLTGNIANYRQWNQQPKFYNRYKIFEPYIQDDWRITKKFTLNLGMRFSLFGTYRERYRQAFNFEPGAFVPANSPTIDPDTGALNPATGNPFNGIIQCGGQGGTAAIPAPTLASFPGATVGASTEPGCMKGDLFNPAPRVGFAWDPKGDGKTAIRGGYGIFYEHTNGNEGNTESLESVDPPLVLTSSQFNVPAYTAIGGGVLLPLGATSIPNRAIWPYVQQWHLDVQRELPGNIVFSTSYVGSKGTHLTLQRNLNQLFPVPAGQNPFAPGQAITSADCDSFSTSGTLANGAPVPAGAANNLNVACGGNPDPLRPIFGVSDITRLENQANSTYNALQVSARRTVGNLTLSAAYTYSHSIDNASDRFDGAFVNSYNLAANRASSNFDLRHNFALSYVYALPFFRGPGLAHTLLGGWQISGITLAQTGTPFSVTNGTDFGDSAGVANGVGTGSRPDQVGDPHAHLSQTEFPDQRGPLLYNPAAYAAPTGLTFGNVGRNTLYLPGRLNFDFGLFKRFSLGESKAIDFRWENFNIFNHTQFDRICGGNPGDQTPSCAMDTTNPGANPNNSDFLHLTGAHRPRTMQFGLRLQF